MGSYIYAKHLKDNNVDVFGMVSVEMIGYFDDKPNSQNYPIDLLSGFYGDRCDFITVVKTFNAGKFANEFNKLYKKSGKINTQNFIAPKLLHGIDYLDHLNYWKFGYSALMLTETSFFRNKNYPKITDTIESLDIPRMSKVIDGLFYTLINQSQNFAKK